MPHLVFIIYFVAFASGVAACTVFAVAGGRTRRVKSYLGFMAAYSFLIAILTAGAYLYANLAPGRLPPALPVYISSVLVGIALLDVTVPWFYHELAGVPLTRVGRSVIGVAALLSLLAIVPVLSWSLPRLVVAAVMVPVAGLVGISVWSLGVVVRNYRVIEDEAFRRAIPVIIGFFGCSVGLGVLDTVLGGDIERRALFPYRGLTLPVGYTAWNLLSLVFARRYFFSPSRPVAAVPEVNAGVIAGLSPKETEIVRLIMQGKANKEIAGQLGVSFNTVRNHIASIFLKAGVRSRTELFAKIVRS